MLEPYAKDVLLKHREGKSMQDIVNWLSEPSRNVAISRQAVHAWLTARIKKLVKLNVAYENTGVGRPFQEYGAVWAPQPLEKGTGLDPPPPASIRPAYASRSETEPPAKQPDISDFMVDEFEFNRDQNPMISKP